MQTRDAFLAKVASELSARVESLAGTLRQRRVTSAKVEDLAEFARELAIIARADEAPEVRSAPIDLGALTSSVVARWRSAARGPGRSSSQKVSVIAKGDAVGEWDRAHLETILGELVSNACKYGEGRDVEILIDGSRERVRLIVDDGGKGIASRDKGTLGRRFTRGRAAETSGAMGFGVGVWLVTRLARAHGGTFRLARSSRGGTRAIVALPR